MAEVRARLEKLGLGEYTQRFLDERFDTWKTLVDITEQDLHDLDIKLGHRRKLQRAIAEWRRETREAALAQHGPITAARLEGPSYTVAPAATAATTSSHESAGARTSIETGVARTKRKYRRHPKPDVNAPERPPSAYVMFSNHVRELLDDQDLSFTEMAKVVGERWQVLPSPDREDFKGRAAAEKDKYNAELADYKKTDKFREYQAYLKDFKAQAAGNVSEAKRARSDLDSGDESPQSALDQLDSPPCKRRLSGNSMGSGVSSLEVSLDHAFTLISPRAKTNIRARPRAATTSRDDTKAYRRRSTASSSVNSPFNCGALLNKSVSADQSGSRQSHDAPVRFANFSSSGYAPLQYLAPGPPASAAMYPFGFGSGMQSAMRSERVPPANRSATTTVELADGPASPIHAILDADLSRSRRVLPMPVAHSYPAPMAAELRPPLVDDDKHLFLRHDSSRSTKSSQSVAESPIEILLRASELMKDPEEVPSSNASNGPAVHLQKPSVPVPPVFS